MATPLDGIRVLDMSRILAGPWCTQTLADLGADVIKVERPGMGDDSRVFGPPFLKTKDGKDLRQSAMYLCANRNKRSISIDFTKPEGRKIILDLAAKSDVLMENYKVGNLKRYGLDYASLHKDLPRLIYCSLTGFGQDGPYAERGGTDPIVQAMSGFMSITGHAPELPGGTPMKAGPSVVDLAAGLYAVIAIQGALYHRDHKGGKGQHIDISLLDAGIALIAQHAMHYYISGKPPLRLGTQANGGAPGGGFRCADGDIMIAPNSQELYERFVKLLGRPDLCTDPRFSTNPQRIVHRNLLMEILEEITMKWKVKDLHEALNKVGVPSTPVNTIDTALADPQVVHRGIVKDVPQPAAGTVKLVTSPIRYSETPIERLDPPPEPGQHTDQVLGELLGMGSAEIARLREAKVIG
jgi:crotonobetainyl-CoA:carnitine CoA-transferase CaiB-like acyl-CoA transferase